MSSRQVAFPSFVVFDVRIRRRFCGFSGSLFRPSLAGPTRADKNGDDKYGLRSARLHRPHNGSSTLWMDGWMFVFMNLHLNIYKYIYSDDFRRCQL